MATYCEYKVAFCQNYLLYINMFVSLGDNCTPTTDRLMEKLMLFVDVVLWTF